MWNYANNPSAAEIEVMGTSGAQCADQLVLPISDPAPNPQGGELQKRTLDVDL